MAKQAKKRSGASKKAVKATAKKAAKKSAGAKKPPAKKPAKKPARGAAKSAKKGAATAKKSGVKAAKAPSTKRQRATPPRKVANPGTAQPITHEDPAERAQDAVDQGWDQVSAAGMADEADVEDQSAEA